MTIRRRRSSGSGTIRADFLLELALQVLGVGGDPDGAGIAARPTCGRREIAEGLAEAGAGFGEDDVVADRLGARLKGARRLGAIVHLLRAGLGIGTEQVAQIDAGLIGADRGVARRRPGPFLLPFRQAVPNVEAGGKRRQLQVGIPLLQGSEHGLGPWPAGAAQELAELGGLAAPREARVGETGEQRLGHGGNGEAFVGIGGDGEAAGEAIGQRHGGHGRGDEGEELGNVEVALVAGGADRRAGGGGSMAQALDQIGGVAHDMGRGGEDGEGACRIMGEARRGAGPDGDAGAGSHCNGKGQGGERCGGEGHRLQLPPKAAEGQAQVLHGRSREQAPRREMDPSTWALEVAGHS